jgi:23S rRNA (cytosine1962-C5)-methyltransferase
MTYELIDCGNELKLERFGPHLILRPCGQAIWRPRSTKNWDKAEYIFSREGKNHWKKMGKESSWVIDFAGFKMKIEPTDFGHLGLFAEHQSLFDEIAKEITGSFDFLNLFAYTGAATLAAAKAGARVCHVDASKKTVAWARENARLSHLEDKPIRWIVDDVMKFLKREISRGQQYSGILLDPPSFGRGAQGQVFKIETDLIPLLEMCSELLKEKGRFLFVSCHTPEITPLVLKEVVSQIFSPNLVIGEMSIKSQTGIELPFGSFAKWSRQ